jgi:hypothetical protein
VTPITVRDIGALVAAALAFDPAASRTANVERMTDEAGRLRTFAVGRSLDPAGATVGWLRAMASEGFELVTLYGGPGLGSDDLEAVRATIAAAWPGVTVDMVPDGEARHALLVALD